MRKTQTLLYGRKLSWLLQGIGTWDSFCKCLTDTVMAGRLGRMQLLSQTSFIKTNTGKGKQIDRQRQNWNTGRGYTIRQTEETSKVKIHCGSKNKQGLATAMNARGVLRLRKCVKWKQLHSIRILVTRSKEVSVSCGAVVNLGKCSPVVCECPCLPCLTVSTIRWSLFQHRVGLCCVCGLWRFCGSALWCRQGRCDRRRYDNTS